MKSAGIQNMSTVLIVSIAGAVLGTRLFLWLVPEAGGSPVFGVHVHHLLIGILLVCLGGIPAVLLRSEGLAKTLAVAVFGVGLGLALDEWVLFVIREAAPDAPYMHPQAVEGAAILTAFVVVYTVVIDRLARRERS